MSKASEEVANLEREVEHLRKSCSNFAMMNDQQGRQINDLLVKVHQLSIPANERMRAMQSKIDKQSDRIAKLEDEMVALRQLGAAARRYAAGVER